MNKKIKVMLSSVKATNKEVPIAYKAMIEQLGIEYVLVEAKGEEDALEIIRNTINDINTDKIEELRQKGELLVCKECGSDHVQILAWCNANTLEHETDGPEGYENNWCVNCEDHVRLCFNNEFEKD